MSNTAEKNDKTDKDKGDKTVTIFVNTRPHELDKKDEISFEEVVTLAYPGTPPYEASGYSVSYERAEGGREGTLVAGQKVKVKDGMRFDVIATHKS